FIEPQAFEHFGHATVDSVTRVALRHDDEVRIDFVLGVHRRTIARHRIVARDDRNAGRHGAALLFQRLIVQPQARESGVDALAHETADRHAAAMSRVAGENDWHLHAPRDPLGEADALGHRENPEIGESGVIAAGDARAHKTALDPAGFHDLGMKSIRRTQYSEDFSSTPQQFFKLESRSGGLHSEYR